MYSAFLLNICHLIRLQSLAIDIYMFLHNLLPCIIINISKVNQTVPYDLRKRNVLQRRNPNSVRYGTKTISCIVPKIWSLNPETIKSKFFQTKNKKMKA